MPNEGAKEVLMAGGKLSSSELEEFHLIPFEPLRRLAARFALGRDRKREKAWNATSSNQDALRDVPFALSRIDHTIAHCMKLRDKLVSGEDLLFGDDDAGGIIWGGAYLCCATVAIQAAKTPTLVPVLRNCSACGGLKTVDVKRACGSCAGWATTVPGDCISCHGSRTVSIPEECPACKGSGKSKL